MFKCFFLSKYWFKWSVFGTLIILFSNWYRVQLDVDINSWFGLFYDLIQKALTAPNTVSMATFQEVIIDYFKIVSILIFLSMTTNFFIRHWIFRWRTALNFYYMKHWNKINHIEGASQRIQEDTMRFAKLVEDLGVSISQSLITLFLFIPILWNLSKKVPILPFFGYVEHSMVMVTLASSSIGIIVILLAGNKLPGLEFNNQKVEAAYRKELVLGEDDKNRANKDCTDKLFMDLSKNYFTMYKNYLYFDVISTGYVRYSGLAAYIFLGPSILSGVISLGVLQQILKSYNKVDNSFRLLVRRWSSCVELMSIYKRLKSFENEINTYI